MTLLALALVFVIPVAGSASSGSSDDTSAVVPASLLAQAAANPSKSFKVIVQGVRGKSSGDIAKDVGDSKGTVKKVFSSISGVSATLLGGQIVGLAHNSHVLSITPDAPVQASAYEDAEMWRDTVDVSPLYGGPKAPTIAIVDSGIDTSKVDFGSRIVANVNLSSLSTLSSADQEGHGTMVAAIAAGAVSNHLGASPTSPIVSIKTADGNGLSVTSDVIAACDWILSHRTQYNIRVANFSMAGAAKVSFRFDPLDKAVERLWFAGVTVVAAAGNSGTGSAIDMSYAPANDPYVITVGATDQHSTADPSDDDTPAWSAFGHTMDGFGKPDVSAPGRYMVAAVPTGATIPLTVPDRIVAPGYIWMSGTSFSTPVVSGAAAQILARHPAWTPDNVKGALMLTANYLPNAAGGVAGGVGEIDAAAAASLDFTPPDPNENLHAFEVTDPVTGAKTFNQANWAAVVAGSANWAQANWSAANWASANWAQANWATANWSQANWSADVSGMMTSLASWSE